MKLAKEFIRFATQELALKSLPKGIKFTGDEYAAQHLTFGTYQPSTDEIVVVTGQRHPIDVLRTLAHELVHHKQREEGKTPDGRDGSEVENEANALAGVLMRKFRTLHPEIFNVGAYGFHTNMENTKAKQILKIAKTGKVGKVDETYVDKFNARLLVTVMHKLNPTNQQKFLSESVDKMIAVAYKIVTK